MTTTIKCYRDNHYSDECPVPQTLCLYMGKHLSSESERGASEAVGGGAV